MFVNFQPPPPGQYSGYLSNVLDTIRRALSSTVNQNEAVARIILQSPNGKSWDLTVSNAGVATVTANDGKTRP